MAQQTINVGSAPDDGTGDPARVAFTKCNANFTELYTADTAFLTTTVAATTYQPLDADLTAIAALTGTNTIYYRSGTSTWSPVTVGTGLTFTSGTLAATGGGLTLLYNYIGGLTLSNGPSDLANDITVQPGQAADSTNTGMMTLTSALTKQIDAAWAVGSNAGGRDTSTLTDTTYHVFLIYNPTGPVVDVLFSSSITPTLPSGYTLFRRIGSIIRVASALLPFRQTGNSFIHSPSIFDINVTQAAARGTFTLTVPRDILPLALIRVYIGNASTSTITVVCDPAEPDAAPSGTASPGVSIWNAATANSAQEMQVRTNASSQVCARPSTGSTTIRMTTIGWIDHRGYV